MSKDNKTKLNFVSSNNTIYIHGEFDDTMSENIIPLFHAAIERESKIKEGKIIIDIASHGGIANYLKIFLSLIEKAKKEGIIVETRVLSHAYSCGSLLAASGTKGHRFIGEFAEHLCHLGSGSTGTVINDTELERSSARIKAHFDFVRTLYKKYATIPKLDSVIKDDHFFIRGQQILDWGLADKFF